jgi:hypothetical protein
MQFTTATSFTPAQHRKITQGFESGKKSVERGRAELVAQAGPDTTADRLVELATNVAVDTARLSVLELAYVHLVNDGTPAALQGQLLDMLIQGADDTWSGRRNDLARAKHDAVRDQIRRVLETLVYNA